MTWGGVGRPWWPGAKKDGILGRGGAITSSGRGARRILLPEKARNQHTRPPGQAKTRWTERQELKKQGDEPSIPPDPDPGGRKEKSGAQRADRSVVFL